MNQEQVSAPENIQEPKFKKNEPDNLDEIFKRISDDFVDVKPLTLLAQKLNIVPGQLILGLIFLAFTLTIFGAGTVIVKILIGMLYPGYQSIQCLKQKDDQKAKVWVAYWIIFLLSFLVDRFMWFTFHDLLSLYYPVKTMFLIWMFYPKTRGAIIVFDILVNKLINVGLVEKKKQN